MKIEAKGCHYKTLNEKVHQAIAEGAREIFLDQVNGQRYLGDAIQKEEVQITIRGTPGNDLAAFMDGPTVTVHGNAQDGVGNTMNGGKIIIHGDAGDIAGYAMRGGKIYIQGNAGYRVGIHMKAFNELFPVIIIGGRAGNFLGEYMAGGLIIVLGLGAEEDHSPVGTYVGTGMHAGKIYIRGRVRNYQLGKEIRIFDIDEEDREEMDSFLAEYCRDFSFPWEEIRKGPFVKLIPFTHRPYGKLYAY
jgi:glutamate synthase domain-containing protein 3